MITAVDSYFADPDIKTSRITLPKGGRRSSTSSLNSVESVVMILVNPSNVAVTSSRKAVP